MAPLSGGLYFCFLLIADLVLLGLTVAIEFDSGSMTLSSMKLLGDAHLSNESFRLTRDVGVPYSGAGKVLYSKPIKFRRPGSESPASFSTFFSFCVTNLNPSSIGGGIAFVISPDDDYVGDAGGFLGAMDGEGSQKNVVAVEFDTLLDVEFKDINGNHVGLDLNSMVSSRVGNLDTIDVDLKSGDLVNAWVDYSGPNRTIKVYVSYSNLKPRDPILSDELDLNDFVVNDFMFVGFSGSTQGSTEIHSIEWWSFTSTFDDNPSAAAPPTPTASLMNPTASAAKSPPPTAEPNSTVAANTTSYDKDSNGDGKCHNQLCKSGPGAVAGVVTASAFFLGFCAVALIWVYGKKFKRGKKSDTLASDVIKMPKEFGYKELNIATKGFDSNRVIGHGAYGTVYRGTLPATGDAVAVKRCTLNGQGKAEFLSELSIIATLRHRNLVRLQGWCHDKGESLLVYDLMSNGSLDKALYESRMTLPWPHRRRILLGVASALTYLHQECENQVIHRDIKASNIMLDEGFNARLGDFGLARLIEHDKSPDATVAAGTMGYLAPEYLLTGRASDKTDVFSYGAVVLEVASGRRPIEKDAGKAGGGRGGNLVEWVWGLHREGRLMMAADARLGNEFNESEMRRVLLVGLACSHPDPAARPAMRAVVQMLVGEAEVPVVPRAKPTLSFSTSELLLTLQDSVSESDLNCMIAATSSSSSSENSLIHHGGVDLV
ncbi:L-type lectin-domain containing receptor kinase VIII.1-like [Andrographis paniculata]|uniref:L-type lectin-domain containing receptor kinase VIII.1-like n=1 Tax=Andrographis paniculata TaxID=175694 RepID=UPI0021E72C07|nr:L-type lectin-domain containing receptor kinase VIII.1-like [Andrographis paniculata]